MEITNMSYIHRPVDFQYHYETVPERLNYMAEKYGDKEVYVFLHPDGRRDSITATELFEKSRNLAHSLIAFGIEKGDIVATCLYNELDLLICTFGVICAGAVILNVVMRNDDGSDLKTTLDKLDVKCLILNPGDDNEQLNACMNFIESINKDGSVDCPLLPKLRTLISNATVKEKQLLQLSDLFRKTEASLRLPRLDPESTIVLLQTSGSTGGSKFVPHSHHDAMIIGYHMKECIGYEVDDVIYTERRIAWIGGFPFMYLHDGVKVVTKTKPFDNLAEHCELTYNVMKNENCTIGCLMPATIISLVGKIQKISKPSSFLLKNIHSGGLPIASVCMDAIGILSEKVTNCYGSTEKGCVTSNTIKNKREYINHSTGRPHAGVELKVVDMDGYIVKKGTMGNLFVRSPDMFPCYYNDEAKTKEVLSPNRWMDTDDMGYITQDEQLVVNGRRSDIILQNGRYMVPSQIEALIQTHPNVLEVVVISIPDDSAFELVCACVIPFAGKVLTTDDIEDFYTKRIMSFSSEAFSHDKPGLIMVFEFFPKLYTGKPDKVALKKEVLARLQKQ